MSDHRFIDFQDGRGAVLSRRHKNPDDTQGGWVAGTASVTNTAYIGFDARVYGEGRVYETAGVFDFAQVFGQARVSGRSRITDRACIFGLTEVWGDAVVGGDTKLSEPSGVRGDAFVMSNRDVFWGQRPDPYSPRRSKLPWVAYRTRRGAVFVFRGQDTPLLRFVGNPNTYEDGLEEWLRLNTMSDLEYIAHAVEQQDRKLK